MPDIRGRVDAQLGGKTFIHCGDGPGETVLVLRGVDLGEIPAGSPFVARLGQPPAEAFEAPQAPENVEGSPAAMPEPPAPEFPDLPDPEPVAPVPDEEPKARRKKASKR